MPDFGSVKMPGLVWKADATPASAANTQGHDRQQARPNCLVPLPHWILAARIVVGSAAPPGFTCSRMPATMSSVVRPATRAR